MPAEKGGKGGKNKGKAVEKESSKPKSGARTSKDTPRTSGGLLKDSGAGTSKDTAGNSRGPSKGSGVGTSKDTAGPSRLSTKDSVQTARETEVTDLTQTEESPSEKCDPPQGRTTIVFNSL